jgi:hypothetical protein
MCFGSISPSSTPSPALSRGDSRFTTKLSSARCPAVSPKRPSPRAEALNQPPGSYRLRDNKRVRSRETHFCDHPRFGVLLRITPSPPPS